MAQRAKLHKHEDPSSNPQHLCKTWVWQCVSVSPVLMGVEMATLAGTESFRFMLSQKQKCRVQEEDPGRHYKHGCLHTRPSRTQHTDTHMHGGKILPPVCCAHLCLSLFHLPSNSCHLCPSPKAQLQLSFSRLCPLHCAFFLNTFNGVSQHVLSDNCSFLQ